MITIKEIANILGISHSTVSRALNGHHSISDATKKKVKETATSLGYIVNQAANTMKGSTTNSIGLLIPDIDNVFYAKLTSTLTKRLQADNINLILSITNDDAHQEEQAIRQLLSLRPKSIFVVTSPNITEASATMLRDNHCTLIIRKQRSLENLSFIGIDEELGMKIAVDHLYKKGHKKIAYLGRSTDTSTGTERLNGFINACKVLNIEHTNIGLTKSNLEDAKSAMAVLWQNYHFSAIVLGGEIITQGVWSFLTENNIESPGKIEVVNFGNFEWSQVSTSNKCYLSLPLDEISASCYQLIKNIDDKNAVKIRYTPVLLNKSSSKHNNG